MSGYTDLLDQLPIPDHHPDFWTNLESKLAITTPETAPEPTHESARSHAGPTMPLMDVGDLSATDGAEVIPIRRRVLPRIVAVAAATVLVVIGILLTVGDEEGPPADTPTPTVPSTTPTPTPTPTVSDDGEAETTLEEEAPAVGDLSDRLEVIDLDLVGTPVGAIEVGGTIWVTTEEGALHGVDPVATEIVASIDVAERLFPGPPAVTDDALWVLGLEGDGAVLHRVDRTTEAVVASIPVGSAFGGHVAAAADVFSETETVWVTANDPLADSENHVLRRIDPATNEITFTIPLETFGAQQRGAPLAANGVEILHVAGSSAWYLVANLAGEVPQVVAEIPREQGGLAIDAVYSEFGPLIGLGRDVVEYPLDEVQGIRTVAVPTRSCCGAVETGNYLLVLTPVHEVHLLDFSDRISHVATLEINEALPDLELVVRVGADIWFLGSEGTTRVSAAAVNDAVPEPSATRAIAVRPESTLPGDEFISVEGVGFPRRAQIGLRQCVVDRDTLAVVACDSTTATTAFTDETGRFLPEDAIRARRNIATLDGAVDCAAPGAERVCAVVATSFGDANQTATAALTFDPEEEAGPAPVIRLSSTALTAGDSVTVSGEGFRSDQPVRLVWCSVPTPFFDTRGCDSANGSHLLLADDAGAFTTEMTALVCSATPCHLVGFGVTRDSQPMPVEIVDGGFAFSVSTMPEFGDLPVESTVTVRLPRLGATTGETFTARMCAGGGGCGEEVTGVIEQEATVFDILVNPNLGGVLPSDPSNSRCVGFAGLTNCYIEVATDTFRFPDIRLQFDPALLEQ